MSDPQAQLQDVEDLDASVDALMQDIEASGERVERRVKEVSEPTGEAAKPAEPEGVDDSAFADFETAHAALGGEPAAAPAQPEPAASTTGGGETMEASKSALDALLRDAEEELAEGEPSAAEPEAAAAAAIAEVDAAFAAPEALAEPPAPAPEPARAPADDAAKLAELESRANQPPVDIEQLDKALAQSAEAVMADAQKAKEPEPAPPPPAPEPVVKAPEPAPTPPAPAPAEAVVAAAVVTQAEPKPTAGERVASAFAPVGRVVTAALMPLNTLHARLPEQTRQTVAYLAIMNVFFASVVWFMAMRPKPEAEVSYDVKTIYLSEMAAREAEKAAKAKAEAEGKKGGHGEEKKDDGHGGGGGGHGEAKKPEKKADKKDAGGHGEAKKPEKKADKKASAKKDAGHGGGGH